MDFGKFHNQHVIVELNKFYMVNDLNTNKVICDNAKLRADRYMDPLYLCKCVLHFITHIDAGEISNCFATQYF